MTPMHWRRILWIGCVVALVGSGCSAMRRRGQPKDDLFAPEPLDGDYSLGQRFEEGTPVTDARLAHVYFSYDSFQITDSEVAKIERAADYMRRHPNVKLVSEGHCDERGSREYNLSLGEHRALAVRAHLIGLGIDGARIQTRSYGEERPLDFGHHESAWRRNRRVEFKLYRP